MTQNKEVSIELMNEVIAVFDGWEKATIGYFGQDDETEWQRQNEQWLDKVGLEEVGDFYVNVKENRWEFVEDVNYHTDWNQLHSAWEKFRDLKLDSSRHQRTHALHKDFISRQIAFGTIETAHLILWDAITWYNKNTTP